MIEPSVTITIGGNDVSDDFVSLRTEQDICRLAQTCEIELKATSGAHAYDPWDTLVVAINGTSRLTGYVDNADKNRGNYTVQGKDKMKLALEMFITEEVRVEIEADAGYWVNYWLEQAGLTTSGSVLTGRNVPMTLPDEDGWIYIAVSDIILECLGYAGGGWVVFVDGDGVAQIVERATGENSHTLSPAQFSRTQDDSWFRDRAVVFGVTSGSWVDDVWVPGETTVVAEAPDDLPDYPRTTVLSSTYVQNRATAEDLADDIYTFFNENLDVKRVLISGDESIWLCDEGATSDSWSGYGGEGLITSIETTIDDSGFRQLVSLDERCGFVWGFGLPYAQVMFGTSGSLLVGDYPPWFVCDLLLDLRNTFAAVKIPSVGADIEYEIESSTDGITWTSLHAGTISAGQYLSGEQIITDTALEEDTLLRLNVTQVGSDILGVDLTVSAGVKLR